MSDREPLLINRRDEQRQSPSQLLHTYLRPCLAEFFGSTLFISVSTMATCNGSTLLANAITDAFVLSAIVAINAKVSGGHYNPIVSFAVFLVGELSLFKTLLYSLSQILGGIAGAGITRLAMPYDVFVNASGGCTKIGDGVTAGQAITCEILLTAVLMIVVLLTAVDKVSQITWWPLAIGLVVGANVLAGGTISGASMNPARSFGPLVMSFSVDGISDAVWKYHYIYWVGPMIGSCFAVLLYRLLFAGPEKNLLFH